MGSAPSEPLPGQNNRLNVPVSARSQKSNSSSPKPQPRNTQNGGASSGKGSRTAVGSGGSSGGDAGGGGGGGGGDRGRGGGSTGAGSSGSSTTASRGGSTGHGGGSTSGHGGNKQASDEIVFETFFHKDGKSYCCIFTNGCRFYLDSFKSGEWKEFPWEWYSEGTLVTDEVQDNQQAGQADQKVENIPTSSSGESSSKRSKQQTDDREGVMKVPGKGVYQTYVFEQRRNVHCYYDSEEGSWIKIPIRWELTTPLAKTLVKRVQTTLSQWHDEVDIMASLRVSNYNVDDCINTYLATVGSAPARLSREKSVIAQSDSVESMEKRMKSAEKRVKELETMLNQEREEKQYLQKKYDQISESMATTRAECQAAIAQVNALKESRPKTAVSKRPGMESVPRESLTQITRQTQAIVKAQLQVKSEFEETKKKVLVELAKVVGLATKIKACEKSSSSEIDELRTLYRREVLQRKLLYNQLQELRGNIRVFARCRNDPSVDVALTFPGDSNLQINSGGTRKTFNFDRVFEPKCTQEQVFAEVLPIVTSCVDGYHVCILAYGQTGSGKTYTMEGPANNPGVNVRAIRELLRICDERKETVGYVLKVGMVEIYNETIQDLLSSSVNSVDIRAQGNKVQLQGLMEQEVKTEEDIARIMETGSSNRKIASTKMNSQSSRSHLLVILSVTGTDKVSGTVSKGQLTLCDLAGSERVSKTEAEGARLTEAAFINKSLTSLGQVFTALRTNQLHIPYRNSKLSHILQPSLGGDAKACLFVNVRSDSSNAQETISSLQFGANARQVALGQAKANVSKK